VKGKKVGPTDLDCRVTGYHTFSQILHWSYGATCYPYLLCRTWYCV